MSAQQYLDMDRMAGVKHEYVDGVAYAMAGGTSTHNQLSARVIALLVNSLQGTACRVFSSDMRVQVEENRFFYPDATVGCDPRDAGPGIDILSYPKAIVEVLSRSTEPYDRGQKFEMYRGRDSLQDYVLISQREPVVDVFHRTGGEWVRHTYGQDDEVELPSIGIRFRVQEVYSGIQLPDATAT